MSSEQWKDEILDSLRGAKRAEPNPFLFTRIANRIESIKQPIGISPGQIRLAVSLCLLLVMVNVTLMVRHLNSSTENTEPETSTYSLSSHQYQLY